MVDEAREPYDIRVSLEHTEADQGEAKPCRIVCLSLGVYGSKWIDFVAQWTVLYIYAHPVMNDENDCLIDSKKKAHTNDGARLWYNGACQ